MPVGQEQALRVHRLVCTGIVEADASKSDSGVRIQDSGFKFQKSALILAHSAAGCVLVIGEHAGNFVHDLESDQIEFILSPFRVRMARIGV